jgi:hypothetical protein
MTTDRPTNQPTRRDKTSPSKHHIKAEIRRSAIRRWWFAHLISICSPPANQVIRSTRCQSCRSNAIVNYFWLPLELHVNLDLKKTPEIAGKINWRLVNFAFRKIHYILESNYIVYEFVFRVDKIKHESLYGVWFTFSKVVKKLVVPACGVCCLLWCRFLRD